ncbi:cupin domain-containing protein [Halobacterium litoreum]|uniref:Cupin domain-containing protein n=1 Tax=Halobacterium litoreum TaxID=2039234 RepID=A0ABD5NBU1_9EURY|nr:cupin domain-containing protein [Halobacterium litoreum]UHH14369.1 cupin domain-containing protein [Halobacterium litoreum]
MTPTVTDLGALTDEPHARPFPGEEPKTVRLSLDAGESVPAHRHPDRVVVCHVYEGELDVTLGDDTVTVSTGEVARFDGAQDISPRAAEESEALLVLAEK